MRKFVVICLVTIGLAVAAASFSWLGLLWDNNRERPLPSRGEIEASRRRAVDWMWSRRATLLASQNAVLWWMVERSAEQCRDERLRELFRAYRKRHVDDSPGNPWRAFVYPGSALQHSPASVSALIYYNAHWIYALTCDPRLAELEKVQRQLDPDFCAERPEPACTTHQLMGMRYMELSECGDPGRVQDVIRILQDDVVDLLTWDPRVVDVYVQRVMMLVESGAADRVKPGWLRRVLAAQRPDGGWAGFQPLLAWSGDRQIGFMAMTADCFDTGARAGLQRRQAPCWKGPSIGEPLTNFHTTAQGLLLTSLLACEATGEPASTP